jgi:aminoglycoside 2'-N-acetyltransferase I
MLRSLRRTRTRILYASPRDGCLAPMHAADNAGDADALPASKPPVWGRGSMRSKPNATSPARGNLEIHVRSSAELSAQARDEILALCDRAYGEDLRPAFDAFVEPVHVLAMVEGTIVSHALWVTRWLVPRGSAPLRTAYVEAVATDPVHERRGFASAVMRTLVSRVATFQLAALCPSDRGQALYCRLGWERWIGPLSIRQGAGVIETPEESVMIYRLPWSPPLDLTEPLSAEWRPGELW